MLLIGLLEIVPEGPRSSPQHGILSLAPKEDLDIFSVAGQAPSLDRHHINSPGLVAEPTKCFQRSCSLPLRTQYSTVYRCLKHRLGCSHSIKGLCSNVEKSLHINILEIKAVFLALKYFKSQCQNQTVLIAQDNSTVVACINKQNGARSVEKCALMWRIMSWCH